MLSELTVRVPQGVGDQLWVLRYVLPQATTVHLRVINPGGLPDAVVRRAAPLISEVPGVGSVVYEPAGVPTAHGQWLQIQQPLGPALARAWPVRHAPQPQVVTWCCNPGLEAGVPLEQIEPEFPLRWDLGIVPSAVPGLVRNKYLALYVSGDTVRHKDLCERVWTLDQWVTFVQRVCYNASLGTTLPVVLLGAGFDRPATELLAAGLTARGFTVAPLYDLALAPLMWVLGNAAGFLGYQSGLNILAEEAGARQHMLYFPRVVRMGNAWVRPAGRAGVDFRWSSFADHPAGAANLVHLRLSD